MRILLLFVVVTTIAAIPFERSNTFQEFREWIREYRSDSDENKKDTRKLIDSDGGFKNIYDTVVSQVRGYKPITRQSRDKNFKIKDKGKNTQDRPKSTLYPPIQLPIVTASPKNTKDRSKYTLYPPIIQLPINTDSPKNAEDKPEYTLYPPIIQLPIVTDSPKNTEDRPNSTLYPQKQLPVYTASPTDPEDRPNSTVYPQTHQLPIYTASPQNTEDRPNSTLYPQTQLPTYTASTKNTEDENSTLYLQTELPVHTALPQNTEDRLKSTSYPPIALPTYSVSPNSKRDEVSNNENDALDKMKQGYHDQYSVKVPLQHRGVPNGKLDNKPAARKGTSKKVNHTDKRKRITKFRAKPTTQLRSVDEPRKGDQLNSLKIALNKIDHSKRDNGFSLEISVSDECEGTIERHGTSGTIHSPSYPNHYPEMIQCVWQIIADPGQTISLTFTAFTLEAPSVTNSCYDQVLVTEGEVALLPITCGSELPAAITSQTNHVTVVFYSDSSVTTSGFALDFEVDNVGTGEDACNGATIEVSGDSGSIRSPNYPENYPHSCTVSWVIHAHHDEIITLTFNVFELEGRSSNGCYDTFEVYRGVNDRGEILLIDYCEQPAPNPITSQSSIFIRFISDISVEARGFDISYVKTREGPEPSPECTGDRVDLEADSGTFASSLYPEQYGVNTICVWKITAPIGKTINLSFQYFDLEKPNNINNMNTCYDWVRVYDAENDLDNSKIILNWCGPNAPEPIESETNHLFIVFSSDYTVVADGFLAQYYFVGEGGGSNPGTCLNPMIMNQESGSFRYPDSGDYPNDASCSWHIQAHHDKIIVLTALSFSLEDPNGGSCEWDYVRVFDGPDASHQLLGTFCGDDFPSSISSTTSELFITFTSDYSVVDTGFAILYETVGEITIPGPPSGQDSCGIPAVVPYELRIVGGREAIPHSWPWQISIQSGDFHFCGGSIINELWILTAAHCMGSTNFNIVVGDHSFADGEASQKRYGVADVISHPDYNARIVDNDIALVKLTEPIVMSDQVSPVCLPQTHVMDDFMCTITGWGETQGTALQNVLNQANVPTINSDDCNDYYSESGGITDNMFCAGYEEGGLDTCQGDSGGPFVCKTGDVYILYGLTSWGFGCAQQGYPGVYTKVTQYLDWIQQYVGILDDTPGHPISNGPCYGTAAELQDPSGTFVSPAESSGLYPDLAECSWRITVAESRKIKLTFTRMDIEESETDGACEYDYVMVYDGADESHDVIGRVCGTEIPQLIVSTTNVMYVVFISDFVVTKAGFEARYEQVDEGPSAPCGGLTMDLSSPTGEFVSPEGAAGSYPNDASCSWRITADVGKAVKITFTRFDLEINDASGDDDGNHSNDVDKYCEYDYVTIYDGDSNNAPLLGKYCGDLTGPVAPIDVKGQQSNVMYIEFISDVSVVKSGFKAIYDQTVPYIPSNDACDDNGLVLEGDSGTITSPSDPENNGKYPNNAQCSWAIRVDINKKVKLSFKRFELEGFQPACEYDYVLIYSVEGTETNVIGKYCDRNIPPDVVGHSNHLVVTFTSDSDLTRNGFEIEYSAVSRDGIECGTSYIPQSMTAGRIVGGQEAVPNSWPWQVSLQQKRNDHHFCGGSIINSRWILTAAHCVEDDDVDTKKVVAGEHNRDVSSGLEQEISIDAVFAHADYDDTTLMNDIALYRLEDELEFNEYVRPICLPSSEAVVDEVCAATGWGVENHDASDTPKFLKQTWMPIVSHSVCSQLDWNGNSVDESMLCAGYASGGTGICFGDSGGPLVCKNEDGRYELHGASSWVIECAGVQRPSAFTRISRFVSWIESIIHQNENYREQYANNT